MPVPTVLLARLVVLLNDLDPVPVDRDIKAGWGAFAIFIGLFLVVGLLGWSLTRHLRRVEANRRAGVYDDVPDAGAPGAAGPDRSDAARPDTHGSAPTRP